MKNMENNGYTFNDYFGKTMLDKPCHTYELRRNGEVILRLNVSLEPDGTENMTAKKHFLERAEKIMDANAMQ